MASYSGKFYSNRRKHTVHSAITILNVVRDYVSPTSVVDVGCGTGTWLSSAKTIGATNLQGIEGSWVNSTMLDDSDIKLTNANLALETPNLGKFDLAISLEVAEHLPPERAETFVRDLCAMSDHVLFSAAIPGQGGKGHVNEQWQSYWRRLFKSNGYGAWDVIRPPLWENKAIVGHYKQNAVLYVRGAEDRSVGPIFDVVHPSVFHHYTYPGFPTTMKMLMRLPTAFRQSAKKYLGGTQV